MEGIDRGVAHCFPKWTILYTKFSFFPHFLGRDRGFCRDILGILGQLNRREKSGQPTGIDIHSRVQSAKKYRL